MFEFLIAVLETLVIDSEVETKRPARWPVFLFENVISLLVFLTRLEFFDFESLSRNLFDLN